MPDPMKDDPQELPYRSQSLYTYDHHPLSGEMFLQVRKKFVGKAVRFKYHAKMKRVLKCRHIIAHYELHKYTTKEMFT